MSQALANPPLDSHTLASPAPGCPDTNNTPPDFDCLARAYRWMEWLSFGPFLSLCRSTYLPRLTLSRRALVLGDGDGRFTSLLLRQNPSIRIHAVDASAGMLAALTRNCGPNTARLSTEQADLRSWQPGGTLDSRPAPVYDLAATHFFLDCLSSGEVFALAQRIRPTLTPDALWVISEFAIPDFWLAKLVATPIVRGLYLAFGLLTGLRPRTLPDYATALLSAGFIRCQRRTRLGGLLVSELWTAERPSSSHPPPNGPSEPARYSQSGTDSLPVPL